LQHLSIRSAISGLAGWVRWLERLVRWLELLACWLAGFARWLSLLGGLAGWIACCLGLRVGWDG